MGRIRGEYVNTSRFTNFGGAVVRGFGWETWYGLYGERRECGVDRGFLVEARGWVFGVEYLKFTIRRRAL